MADAVSSIITIATVSLAIIRETVRYIKEVRLIDKVVDRLRTELKDLHRLIKVVESTYQRADYGEHSEPSVFVRRYLTKCRDHLEQVRSCVIELASHNTNTVYEKLKLKRRSDGVKKDIESATNEIHRYMRYIRTGIDCWNLDVASAHRRLSEAMAAQQVTLVQTDLQQSHNQDTSPLDRSLSNAETVYGHESTPSVRTASVATSHTSHSRPSVSSASSQALHTQSDDNESTLSSQGPISPRSNNDSVDFHYQITRRPYQDIRTILQQHAEPSTLARSTDGLQRTPLHLAAQRGDIQLAEVLLEYGADVDAKDSEPATVLDFAVAFNNSSFVAFLLERGVNETLILDRNKAKFKEMKRIIDFKKNLSKAPRKEHRKLSWGRGTRLAT